MTASSNQKSSWYVSAMERLVSVVQDLSQARDVAEVTAVVREAARNLTGADGATFVLRDGDRCYYAEENAIAPLWKGKRFPMQACISGWVMLNGQSAVIEDIYEDPRIPADAYRPTFVKSLAMVPVRRDAPIGAIGNYWAERRVPTDQELAILQALADTTSVALENADLYARLSGMVQTLQAQQSRISQQHASLGVFTRALAHDLREPVRTLMTYSDMLRQPLDDGDKRDTYLRFIGDAAVRMGTLIDSVAHFMRLDAPTGAARLLCRLEDVVSDLRRDLAEVMAERGTTLHAANLPSLIAVPAHLRQLIQNLVANAIFHNDRPITVTIDYRIVDGCGVFSVSDDGTGIPVDESEAIFEPFRRLVHRNDAAGLGLAICRRIVAAYGGQIRCAATPGLGATFIFSLPDAELPDTAVSPAQAVSEEAASLHPAASDAMAGVLIVDDREADLELTELALFRRPKLRCNLRSARDGREAHGILSRSKQDIDLVLLDINMPDVDGFRLLQQIREDAILRDVPVIMCSGSDHEPDARRSAELGAAGYLLKPPRFANFKDILATQPSLRMRDDGTGLTLFRVAS